MAKYADLNKVLDIAMGYIPDDDGSCSNAGCDLREMLDEFEKDFLDYKKKDMLNLLTLQNINQVEILSTMLTKDLQTQERETDYKKIN